MNTVTIQHTAEQTVQSEPHAVSYHIEAIEIGDRRGYLFIKRCLDLLFSFVLGIVLLVPMILLGILVWATSKGPAVYRQERLGKDGKSFMMYKFRSMREDAEENGPQWAQKEDDRCTRVGSLLRKTRLDELPQLWNIFKGDMSFVGPRPERECFYDEFETYIHGFRNRTQVKPGLTGHAQVNGGYELKPEEKIVYDMEYIENMSLAMDFKCVFKTVKLIFTHEGAR